MNKLAELQMKEHLGIPEDYKASFDTLYKVAVRFRNLTGSDESITPFGLVCWLDIYGDFTTKRDLYSKIVNQIFIGMGKDLAQVIPFIELCANNYVEEEIDGD